eukprot:CAMPEP_0172784552 /NCGR_PEP_ID=MMETSP1074-20121228/205000_1 /TAXON_ID=2916 /ORGANISM="Ceratium fusus, Strain PA161109" /LENGTH=236 /DNA_ID=CAMNT_0013621555 /DNA_START=51 /DNA_END=763 /DNA_ORIENTATION=+
MHAVGHCSMTSYLAEFTPKPGNGGTGADCKAASGISAAPLQRTASIGEPAALPLLGVLALGLAGAENVACACSAAPMIGEEGNGSGNEPEGTLLMGQPPAPGYQCALGLLWMQSALHVEVTKQGVAASKTQQLLQVLRSLLAAEPDMRRHRALGEAAGNLASLVLASFLLQLYGVALCLAERGGSHAHRGHCRVNSFHGKESRSRPTFARPLLTDACIGVCVLGHKVVACASDPAT